MTTVSLSPMPASKQHEHDEAGLPLTVAEPSIDSEEGRFGFAPLRYASLLRNGV